MDFGEMARKARQSQAQLDAERQLKIDEARAQQEREFTQKVELLNSRVRPILAEVVVAFGNDGIPVTVKDNWNGDIGRPMRPMIEISASSEPIPNKHGGRFQARSVTAFFYMNGEDVVVSLSKGDYGRHPEAEVTATNFEEKVAKAVEAVLSTYHASMSEGRFS